MFKQTKLAFLVGTIILGTYVTNAYAETVPINGMVQSRCIIQTDNSGTYGNPNAYTLTTSSN
jgi:hypothetical protein